MSRSVIRRKKTGSVDSFRQENDFFLVVLYRQGRESLYIGDANEKIYSTIM